MYVGINLLHFHFSQFIVDESKADLSILYHRVQIFFGFEQRHQFFLISCLLVPGYFLLDLSIYVEYVPVFEINEIVYLVPCLLQLDFHDVYIFHFAPGFIF